jgi:hypothetical protein
VCLVIVKMPDALPDAYKINILGLSSQASREIHLRSKAWFKPMGTSDDGGLFNIEHYCMRCRWLM